MLLIANIVISTMLSLWLEAHTTHAYKVELKEIAKALPLRDARKNHQTSNKVWNLYWVFSKFSISGYINFSFCIYFIFFFFFWVWITNMFLKLRIGKFVPCVVFKRSQFFNFNKANKSLPFCVGIVLYWKREMENLVLPAYYLARIRIINNWFRRLLFLLEILIRFAFDLWILMYLDSNKVRVVFFELSF